ncbi:MAG TPA: GNAT family N-acetyltransferase [Acidimicrobiales bacterium]|nr:GNAT family N-acetyltransferase [Acidimicrobiales bacterium]
MTTALVTDGPERARIGPWHGDPTVGCVTPAPGSPPVSARLVHKCLDQLARLGFREAVTAAMPPQESAGFVAAGFRESERLHLLERRVTARDRDPIAIPDGTTLRRARRADIESVLRVDSRSFGAFWRLDADGVNDARTATTYARYRVARADGAVVGYAITGRQGRAGYLQRLAVDPDHRGGGIGSALVLDGINWLARWRAITVVVNTQESNATALALYESLGFTRKPDGLTVWSTRLDA